MKNNKGISLVEVLVTCGLLAIMGSIAVVNFGSYRDPVEKSQLFQSAKLWSAKVKTCILNVGGWKIERPAGGNPRPCGVWCGPNSCPHKNKLKTKIGYDCPSEATCSVFTDTTGNEFYCFNIQKEKRGTKYQCIVHFNIKRHREKIYCGTPASYESVDCDDSYDYTANLKEANENKWPDDSDTSTQQADPNAGNTQNTESQQRPSNPPGDDSSDNGPVAIQ